MATANKKKNDSTANIGFEAKLWLAADKLRNNMDAGEYKHVVLGLIFLKYISDSFDEHHAKLIDGKGEYEGANPEDKDEYLAANVFWVPKDARWPQLQAGANLSASTSPLPHSFRPYSKNQNLDTFQMAGLRENLVTSARIPGEASNQATLQQTRHTLRWNTCQGVVSR